MLTAEEVKNIAFLARIGIKDDEIEKYQKDLSVALDFFRELEEIVVDDAEFSSYITDTTDVAREDRTEDFSIVGKEMILKNVPETKDGFVKVKSVF